MTEARDFSREALRALREWSWVARGRARREPLEAAWRVEAREEAETGDSDLRCGLRRTEVFLAGPEGRERRLLNERLAATSGPSGQLQTAMQVCEISHGGNRARPMVLVLALRFSGSEVLVLVAAKGSSG